MFYDSMPYNDDQYFDHVDPGMYPSYINSLIKPDVKNTDDKLASLSEKENKEFLTNSKYNNVYDYLEKNMHDNSYHYGRLYEQKALRDSIMLAEIRKRLTESQNKHDIYFIIIICLLVYIVLQINPANRGLPTQAVPYYTQPPPMQPQMMPMYQASQMYNGLPV